MKMDGFQPLKRPFLFLGVFSLTAILLLPAWICVSQYYMTGLIALVDGATQYVGLAVRFRMHLSGGDGVAVPSIVAGAALFIATPGRSVAWKLAWIVRLLVLCAACHALILFLQVQIACAHSLDQQLQLKRFLLLPMLRAGSLDHFIDLCYFWIYPALESLLWFAAVRNRGELA